MEKKSILIVEDEASTRETVMDLLSEAGYEIQGARDGIEALANLKAESPDLMVLDLMMPKMDGFAVCKELQDPRWSKYRNMPILILTSVREEASRRRYELETGLELNVDDYVEKPVPPDILVERVGSLIKKKGNA